MQIVSALNKWLYDSLNDIGYDYVTKEYIVHTLSSFKSNDIIDSSITIEYCRANETLDFAHFQRIGDYALWKYSILCDLDEHNNIEIFIGQKSYYTCFLKLRKQIRLYEQLADELPSLSKNINAAIKERNKICI